MLAHSFASYSSAEGIHVRLPGFTSILKKRMVPRKREENCVIIDCDEWEPNISFEYPKVDALQ